MSGRRKGRRRKRRDRNRNQLDPRIGVRGPGVRRGGGRRRRWRRQRRGELAENASSANGEPGQVLQAAATAEGYEDARGVTRGPRRKGAACRR